jgi:quercetin dioxygenase-like cupin family protein/quinol monooxygenase YgiN
VDRGGGVRTVPLVTFERGATSFLSGITTFEPGARLAPHSHNCVESVLVWEGKATVHIDGEDFPLGAGEATFVPGNIPHYFANRSPDERMSILWIYASVDATRTFVASGATARIDAEQPAAGGGRDAVTEVADLYALPGAETRLEQAVAQARPLFQAAPGCRTFELCADTAAPGHYRLLVGWTTEAHHLDGFRSSPAFASWRELVMPHLASPPRAGHYTSILKGF